ncbi:MAG: EamA family transporter RarD [Pseudomonadota bacterium]
MSPPRNNNDQSPAWGAVFAFTAFLIWGLCPLYWKVLKPVPAFEILMHRVLWSFAALVPLMAAMGLGREFISALRTRRVLGTLVASTLFVSINWFLFIWAVNHDLVLQTSLGYYINPLVSVFMGALFLKERLRPLQLLAVALAAGGVLYLTVHYGKFPAISLALAFSFGTYGLIRKVAPVGAVVGLAVETFLLSLPAAAYLIYLQATGQAAFLHQGLKIDLFLAGTILVTALPLVLFTLGARRLHLSTVGFLQYLTPTGTFLLAVFVYKEPLLKAQLYSFITIWIALGLYSYDSTVNYRRALRKAP